MPAALTLLKPSLDTLDAYAAALRRDWSPDNMRGKAAAIEQLAAIASDPGAFVASLDDVAGLGPPITLPDGTRVERLPGYFRWLWDGEFCGSISFRWQPGTSALPSHVLGHIGFSVVPWKRGHGLAAQALALLLPAARAQGLAHVELTTDPANIASQRTIERSGGRLVERFRKDEAYGGSEGLRYRIDF